MKNRTVVYLGKKSTCSSLVGRTCAKQEQAWWDSAWGAGIPQYLPVANKILAAADKDPGDANKDGIKPSQIFIQGSRILTGFQVCQYISDGKSKAAYVKAAKDSTEKVFDELDPVFGPIFDAAHTGLCPDLPVKGA